ncbi:SMI1/KNR4 family protein [Mucilaginibacter terrenus]|uniref:SMI1/KNR4 family protein n=1 Tax=Mucilaginibacter terrenus TaxID=2482727 RepID=A0A3E2NTB8_9SPHI|nr:SMI1/KNR4 family protein [Mucilaginibacter terrenus]RFZ84197.1 SMI1/KNR4 family protein [Mucilaginibacter terrenus]
MADWIEPIISKWSLEGIMLNPPATIDEIERIEAVLNFKFPLSFKQFYQKIDGFDEWDMLANSNISIWPLDRILDEYSKWEKPDFIGICDMLINCYAIGFHRHKTGFYKLKDTLPDAERIDATFEELIMLIENDDRLIY